MGLRQLRFARPAAGPPPAKMSRTTGPDEALTSGGKSLTVSMSLMQDAFPVTFYQPHEELLVAEIGTLGTQYDSGTVIKCYDLDDTLFPSFRRKKKRTLATSPVFPRTRDILQCHLNNRALLVICSNQRGVETGNTSLEALKDRVRSVADCLQLPMLAVFALASGYFRKPAPGMFEYVSLWVQNAYSVERRRRCAFNLTTRSSVVPFAAGSVFVGDAAGREHDFAPTDFLAAQNFFELPFEVPEAHFDGQQNYNSFEPHFNPAVVLATAPTEDDGIAPPSFETPCMLVNVGLPGVGKSTGSRHYSSRGYVVLSRDVLGDMKLVAEHAFEALRTGLSVVIDNTSLTAAARSMWIDVAEKCGVPCHCLLYGADHSFAVHMNANRTKLRTLGFEQSPVPSHVISSMAAQYETPRKSEGFTRIERVAWVPKFATDVEKEFFLQLT